MRRGGPGRRAGKAGAAFLALWMTLWLAAILLAVWTMGEAALSGEAGAAVVLLLWVGAALFGLVSAGRSLRALLLGERREPRANRNHRWNDGLDAAAPVTRSAPNLAPNPDRAPSSRPGEAPPPPPPSDPLGSGRRS